MIRKISINKVPSKPVIDEITVSNDPKLFQNMPLNLNTAQTPYLAENRSKINTVDINGQKLKENGDLDERVKGKLAVKESLGDVQGNGNSVNLSLSSRNIFSLYKNKNSTNDLKNLSENLRKIKELNSPYAFRINFSKRNFNIKITHKYNGSSYLEQADKTDVFEKTPKIYHKQSISEAKAYNRTVEGTRTILQKNVLNRSSNLVSINQNVFSPSMMNEAIGQGGVSSSHHDYSPIMKQAKSPYSNIQSLGISVKDIPGLHIDPDEVLKPGSSPFGDAWR